MRQITSKAGKTKPMNAVFAVLGVIALVVFILAQTGVLQSITGNGNGGSVDPALCGDSTGILTVSPVNALEKGTAIASTTIKAGVNGGAVTKTVTSGTTTFAIGDEVEVLVSKADYLDRSFTFTMPCGGYELQAEMFYATSDNPSILVKDPNNGDATVTDAVAGGASNLTAVSVGETVDFIVEFKGTALESSGDLIYVIEFPASSGANITDVSMGGLSKVDVPSVHTTVNAGSEVVAFSVPAVEGATKKSYDVIVTLGASKDLAGGILTDVYAGQEFVDDDGSIQSGVQDASGDAKYENTLDYDFLLE